MHKINHAYLNSDVVFNPKNPVNPDSKPVAGKYQEANLSENRKKMNL